MEASSLRLTVREQLVLSALWFSLNAQSAALLPIVVPVQIWLFIAPGQIGNASQAILLGWLSALGAILSLFIPPVIGLLSDHTTSRYGRRRPYIVAGTLFVLLSAMSIVYTHNIVIFIIGLTFFQGSSNIITAAYQGLMPDRVPKEQRGAASGYIGLMTILGNVGSLLLAAWLLNTVTSGSTGANAIQRGVNLFYALTCLILVLGVIITLLGIHEAPYAPATRLSTLTVEETATLPRLRHWFTQNWLAPWREFNFTMVFLTRFSVMMGLAFFMTFIAYYFVEVAHITNFIQTTATLAIMALLGAVGSALVLGIYSDHVRRAPVVSIASLLMGVTALAFVIAPGGLPLWPLGLIFGLGYGAFTSVDWALSVDAMPSLQTVGKDLGIWSASAMLPGITAPLLGSLLITITGAYGQTALGYRLVFAVATLFLLIASISVLSVRERREIRPNVKTPAASRTVSFGWRFAFQTRAGKARGFLRFWPFWERFTLAIWHIQPIPKAPHGLLQVRFMRHHGRPIDLPGGEHIARGDSILELHFANHTLTETAANASSWILLGMIAEDLQALAHWIEQPDFPKEVRALFGITLLSRGAPRLGFTLRTRPKTLLAWFDRLFMTGLLVLYNQNGVNRLLQGTTYGSYPMEVWMSRAELVRRFGHGHREPKLHASLTFDNAENLSS